MEGGGRGDPASLPRGQRRVLEGMLRTRNRMSISVTVTHSRHTGLRDAGGME